MLDLDGGLAVPGLHDAHAHVAALGRDLEEVDLRGASSVAEVVARIREHEHRGEWIEGRGWDQNLWDGKLMPTHTPLTEAFGDRPVWLLRVDGHAGWGNAALLAKAGIGADTRDPKGGEIMRDASGAPTGVLIDAAMDLVTPPAPSEADTERWLLAAQSKVISLGMTGAHDMGVDAQTDAVYRRLAGDSDPDRRLRLRAHGYADAKWFFEQVLARKPDPLSPTTTYALGGVKLYVDGALGSRGAALLKPYADRRGRRGLLRHSQKTLDARVLESMAEGWQVAAHAIGDRANRSVLDALARAIQRHHLVDHRFRVEHAQIVDLEDIPRFAQLGAVASMQPTHATSDMQWVPERLGPRRLQGAYAWRRFLDGGVHLCFGSDYPVERPDIAHGLYAAITRADAAGRPDGGWLPDQKLSLTETLRAFTTEAAFACHREESLGMLRKGFQADVTCFQRDLSKLLPAAIRTAPVRATVIAGEIVYEA